MFKECEQCGHYESDNSGHIKKTADGVWVCSSCLDTKDYFYCEECNEWHHSDDRSEYESDPVCNDCYSKMPSEAGHIASLTREFNQSRGI